MAGGSSVVLLVQFCTRMPHDILTVRVYYVYALFAQRSCLQCTCLYALTCTMPCARAY